MLNVRVHLAHRTMSRPIFVPVSMNKFVQSAVALLAIPFALASHAAEPPSPAVAVDLYLKTLVNHDEQAIQQLNDYLRADRLRSGRSADYANAADLKKADEEFPGEVAKMAQKLFPAEQQQALGAPLTALMATVQQARQKSECKVLESDKPAMDQDVLTANVKFECELVKAPETWVEGIQRLVRTKGTLADNLSGLKQLQAGYAIPLNFTYQGTFGVSMVPKDKNEAWRNDFAREPVDQMFEAL